MGKNRIGAKYITIKLPEEIVIMIDQLKVQKGFTSRTDVLKYMVRLYYDQETRSI